MMEEGECQIPIGRANREDIGCIDKGGGENGRMDKDWGKKDTSH
jgi:hypothetical protein